MKGILKKEDTKGGKLNIRGGRGERRTREEIE